MPAPAAGPPPVSDGEPFSRAKIPSATPKAARTLRSFAGFGRRRAIAVLRRPRRIRRGARVLGLGALERRVEARVGQSLVRERVQERLVVAVHAVPERNLVP